jgi:hypothetical protein
MTKAEVMRTQVLTAAEQGLSEEEIAEQLGISEARVLRILDTIEAEPKREVEPSDRGKKAPRSFPYKSFIPVAPGPPSPPTFKIDRRKTPAKKAECGTESGHTRHQRLGERPCDRCREAMRVRTEERRHAKFMTFATEEEAMLWLVGKPMVLRLYRCEKQCRDWHVITWNGFPLPIEQIRMHRRVARHRRERKNLLDTLPKYTVG